MKKPCLTIPLIILYAYGYSQNATTFETKQYVDIRDGKTHEMIKVESLWWFNENLNFETHDSDYFKNDTTNCSRYGRLYSYLESSAACP